LITIKLFGGAKKSLDMSELRTEFDNKKISDLLEYLLSIKPKNTLDTKNILVAVNGIDSSALQGNQTILHTDDVVSIIPIIHGGTNKRFQFKIHVVYVELFNIKNQEEKNYDLLDSVRKKFPNLTFEAISSKYILSQTHVQKIIGLSLYAQKHKILLSKKLQTDILLRFAATTQISEAIKKTGIKAKKDFTIIAIGKKTSLNQLCAHLKNNLCSVDYKKNSKFLQKQFNVSKKHLTAVDSKTPLEDILVEKATVLFQ
jgi:tRNA threonylcarbamoyladenosine modification (KEOPS) complex Cgi121 subunit/molybdopterin converting factor small subunit